MTRDDLLTLVILAYMGQGELYGPDADFAEGFLDDFCKEFGITESELDATVWGVK